MTTELRDDLINFSFDNLHNVFKNYHTQYPDENYNIFSFFPRFLECVKKLVCHHVHSCIHCILIFTHFSMQPLALSEPNIIGQTLQIHFDRMLCDVLEKYHSFPGLTLLLGSIFQYVSLKQPSGLFPGIVALSYFIWKQGEGPTLDDTGLFGAKRIFHHISGIYPLPGTPEFFSYLMELLESPERSGTHIFDQQKYVTAAKECLQLYLCSHHKFSKRATQFTLHDQILHQSKPSAWLARLGVHSRIWKARHHFKVQEHNFIKTRTISLYNSFPENSPEHQYYQFVSYRWALVLLPFLLEKSPVSLELADVLRGSAFTMMAQEFPRRRRLAKEAIAKYLLRVESAAGEASIADRAVNAYSSFFFCELYNII
jgi:hypothetical protein